jgi:hypothetical protein
MGISTDEIKGKRKSKYWKFGQVVKTGGGGGGGGGVEQFNETLGC